MLNRFRVLSIASLAILGISDVARAEHNATANVPMTAQVVQAMSVSSVTPLAFGKRVQGDGALPIPAASGGGFTLVAGGTETINVAVTFPDNGGVVRAGAPATPAATDILLVTSPLLTVNGTNVPLSSGSGSFTIPGSASAAGNSTPIRVGGTLAATSASNLPGAYSGNMSVALSYPF